MPELGTKKNVSNGKPITIIVAATVVLITVGVVFFVIKPPPVAHTRKYKIWARI